MAHFTSPLSPLMAYWTGSLEIMGGPAKGNSSVEMSVFCTRNVVLFLSI